MKSGSLIAIIVLVVVAIASIFIFMDRSTNTSTQSNSLNSGSNLEKSGSPGAYTIDIVNFAYSPVELKITKGSTVTWTNKDSAIHTVTSDSGSELNSAELSKNQIYTHTFNEIETYEYHCAVHPSMKARIIVE